MAVEVKSITESIYSAISEAQRAVEESQSQKLLTNYFNEDGTPFYRKHKIYLYKEDFGNFRAALNEMTEYII